MASILEYVEVAPGTVRVIVLKRQLGVICLATIYQSYMFLPEAHTILSLTYMREIWEKMEEMTTKNKSPTLSGIMANSDIS
jgi:hypothetical protein